MRVLSSGLGPQATGLLLGGTPYCSLWHRDSSGLCGQHQISGSAVGAGSSMCTACACCVWLPGNIHKGMQLICTPLVPSSPSLPPQISPWTLPPPLPPFSCSSLPQSLPRLSLLLSLSFLPSFNCFQGEHLSSCTIVNVCVCVCVCVCLGGPCQRHQSAWLSGICIGFV